MRTIDSQVSPTSEEGQCSECLSRHGQKLEFPPSEGAVDQTMSFVCQGTPVWFCKALAINRNAAAELFISFASHALKGRRRSCTAVGSLDGRKNCSEKRQGWDGKESGIGYRSVGVAVGARCSMLDAGCSMLDAGSAV